MPDSSGSTLMGPSLLCVRSSNRTPAIRKEIADYTHHPPWVDPYTLMKTLSLEYPYSLTTLPTTAHRNDFTNNPSFDAFATSQCE